MMYSLESMAGILCPAMPQSRSQVNTPDRPSEPKSQADFLPPSSPTMTTSAAACPMAYGRLAFSMKCFLSIAVKMRPSSTPPTVMTSSFAKSRSAAGSSM